MPSLQSLQLLAACNTQWPLSAKEALQQPCCLDACDRRAHHQHQVGHPSNGKARPALVGVTSAVAQGVDDAADIPGNTAEVHHLSDFEYTRQHACCLVITPPHLVAIGVPDALLDMSLVCLAAWPHAWSDQVPAGQSCGHMHSEHVGNWDASAHSAAAEQVGALPEPY